jgi:hypothetical protein
MARVNSVDPDQPVHPMPTDQNLYGSLLDSLGYSDQKANSADPDQTAQM